VYSSENVYLRHSWIPDIGRTLENLKEMSFNQEDLAADEAIILRGYVNISNHVPARSP
jgi:hypothetical protein